MTNRERDALLIDMRQTINAQGLVLERMANAIYRIEHEGCRCRKKRPTGPPLESVEGGITNLFKPECGNG